MTEQRDFEAEYNLKDPTSGMLWSDYWERDINYEWVEALLRDWKKNKAKIEALRARVKELETTWGLKCDNCGGELELVHNPSLYHPAYYQCKRCKGVGYITKPSISIGMIPVKKEGE